MDLDEFRQQWQAEVQQRQEARMMEESRRMAGEGSVAKELVHHEDDDLKKFQKRERSHVPDDQEVFINDKLTNVQKEALRDYERGADHEHQGKLGDAIHHYRQAYQKDTSVEKLYREKYYSTIKASIQVDKKEDDLVKKLKKHRIDEIVEEGPLMHLPAEVLVDILRVVALNDLSAFTKLTFSCQRLAYLGYSSPGVWKALCLKEYPNQNYTEIAVEELGGVRDDQVIGERVYQSQWRKMYLERPRVWFNGVYISTCNYVRQGWGERQGNPVHMVTYYRYLRFFEDGTCIYFLSTSEPSEVVPVFNSKVLDRKKPATFTKEDGTTLVQPDGISQGTWAIESSVDGRLLVECQGSVDRYTFYMQFLIKSSGKSKHNKLRWGRFWNYNKLTQNEGEFTLKHDKAFYFVRTRQK